VDGVQAVVKRDGKGEGGTLLGQQLTEFVSMLALFCIALLQMCSALLQMRRALWQLFRVPLLLYRALLRVSWLCLGGLFYGHIYYRAYTGFFCVVSLPLLVCWMCTGINLDIYNYIHICVNVCLHTYMFVYIHIYVYSYIYIYVYVLQHTATLCLF